MKLLSDKQQNIIGFIDRFIDDRGYPPTIRDIQKGCGISSTSVVDYNLDILEKKGHIRRHAEVSRGIELVNRTLASEMMVPAPALSKTARYRFNSLSRAWGVAAEIPFIESRCTVHLLINVEKKMPPWDSPGPGLPESRLKSG